MITKKRDFKYINPGTWEIMNDGESATIISYGDFLNTSVNIRERLLNDNINVEVVNARSLKPIDEKIFKKILSKNKPIFIYEEATKIGSLGSYLLIESQNIIIILNFI